MTNLTNICMTATAMCICTAIIAGQENSPMETDC